MAEVLACVPVYGLEAVLVAVSLVLESGNTSAEHVRNVLARLHETHVTHAPVATPAALVLHEAPIADTGRCDQINTVEVDHV